MNMAKIRLSLLGFLAGLALLTCQTGKTVELSGMFGGLDAGAAIDLSAQGELDWAHWGLTTTNSFDHKDRVGSLITDCMVLGTNAAQRADTISVGYSWSDGTPTVSASNTKTALLIAGLNNGFQIQVPADTFPRRLKVYVGVDSAQGRLEADLSDNSAPVYTDASLDSAAGESNRVYTIDFAAAGAGQTLTVTFTVEAMHDPALGSIRLHSAALQNHIPPVITLNSPTNETVCASPGNVLFDATANGKIRKVEFFTNNTLLATITTGPYTFVWTNVPVGAYAVTAVATSDGGNTASTDPIMVYVYTNSGALTASVTDTSGTIDLTAEGTSDWARWGLFRETSFDQKAGVAPQIGDLQIIGSSPVYWFDANTVGYTWSDGTPTAAATNSTTGIYVTDLDNGFEFTVPADTTPKILKVFLGAFAARGKLRVLLNDLSAAPLFDSSVQPPYGTANAVYTVNFKAGSSNQTLVVQYVVDQSFDTYGNVTLQAATLVTANTPPSAGIANITNNAVFLAPTNLVIQATASDGDGSVTNVEFFDGGTKLAECMSSPYQFVWTNTPSGRHTLTARATDNDGATFTSPAIVFFVSTGGGMLSGCVMRPSSWADLSAMGGLDWAHWGLLQPRSFNHRLLVAQQVSDVTKIGDGPLQRFTDGPTTFTWANGTPTLNNPGSTDGIFLQGLGAGFSIRVPADPTHRRLALFVGVFGALGQLEASLSDASAPDYVDRSLRNVWDVASGCYLFDYAAASADQTLTIRFTSADLYDVTYGNVAWAAAALGPSDLSLSNFQKSGDRFSFSFPTAVGASYWVEYTDVFPATYWMLLTNLTGDGTLANVLDSLATSAQRFYRVRYNSPSR